MLMLCPKRDTPTWLVQGKWPLNSHAEEGEGEFGRIVANSFCKQDLQKSYPEDLQPRNLNLMVSVSVFPSPVSIKIPIGRVVFQFGLWA